MAKINAIRWTGRPLELSDMEAYEAEFKTGFDAIQTELGTSPQFMPEFQKRLEALDAELKPKYKLILPVDLPSSKKQWRAMAARFGAPLMIAQSSANPDELVLVVYDKSFEEG